VIELFRRDDEFSINVGGRLLMSSRMHGAEEALAEVAIATLGQRAAPKVLIGGLGCGYTLAAALAKVDQDARVIVVELVPAVIKWNRGDLGELAGWPVYDRRVSVVEGDVLESLRADGERYDVILLDVDNGPIAFTQDTNSWLYSPAGLERMRAALTEGGVVAFWSAAPDAGFSANLQAAGFDVVEHHVRARLHRAGLRHVVWVGTRAEGRVAPARDKVPDGAGRQGQRGQTGLGPRAQRNAELGWRGRRNSRRAGEEPPADPPKNKRRGRPR
jgi:spermidine synthase